MTCVALTVPQSGCVDAVVLLQYLGCGMYCLLECLGLICVAHWLGRVLVSMMIHVMVKVHVVAHQV